MAEYKQIVLGIDQSYQRTGIALFASHGKKSPKPEKKLIKSIDLSGWQTNTMKRRELSKAIYEILYATIERAENYFVVIERIRQFSGKDAFISMDYIKSMGALNATIVDVCSKFDVDVFSVATNAWKARVVGTCKPISNAKQRKYNVPPNKYPTIEWVIKNGWIKNILIELPENSKREKGIFEKSGKKYEFDNDAADAAGLSMFGFIGDRSKLKQEH